jgi:hypothetical protein
VLRASGRVLRPGGTLAVFVIAPAEGLDEADMSRAVEAGPEYVTADPGYESLFATSGFIEFELVDVTDEYAVTAAGWIDGWRREAEELVALLGADEFRERQDRRRNALRVIEAGLLKRYLLIARTPG